MQVVFLLRCVQQAHGCTHVLTAVFDFFQIYASARLVIAFLLDWIMREPLKREWLFEQSDGNCRLMAPFAARLSETTPMWGLAVAPYAEWVTRALWSSSAKLARESAPPTRLTRSTKREVKGAPPLPSAIRAPRRDNLCRGCGKTIQDGCTNCARCAVGDATENMLDAARIGRETANGPEAQIRRANTQRKNALAQHAWKPSDQPAWLTDKYEIGSVEEFRRTVFLKYPKAGALLVLYDAPVQISRIAIKWNKSTKTRRAFSFYFRMFRDKKTGKMRPSGYEPGISIESIDAAKAIYRAIKYKFHDRDAEQEEDKKFSNVHILDLKTLTSVLTGEVYSFPSACDIFGAPASRQSKFQSRVTKPAIERLLRDVTAELELLNRLNREFGQHPVGLPADRCYSPATLAKSYLSAMGIKPHQGKFKIAGQDQWNCYAGVCGRTC